MQQRVLLVLVAMMMLYNNVNVFAQDKSDLQAIVIDSSLTKDANAVVRSEELILEINSINSVTIKNKRIVTVLNKYGDRFVSDQLYYSSKRKIKNLKIAVYDAFGSEIKVYKKKDFEDRSIYDGYTLAQDGRYKYINYVPLKYPYTLVFESEMETSNTAFLPDWKPVSNYRCSVQKSQFKVINNSGIPLRYKEKNFKGYAVVSDHTDQEYFYSLSNTPAPEWEVYGPGISEITPTVLLALNSFHLEGVNGAANNWETMGKWQYDKLLTGRSEIPQETKSEIDNLVKDAKSDREKAKLIYQYVQRKTRYISIQLGIGGWMPFLASDVDRLGYGDCKALTNYTKSLLDSQGINSYYCIVWREKERIDIESDFASMEGNHVILNIPDKEEDIWLECTSQTLPFNYNDSTTDDRTVLAVTPEGGKIKRTKKYLPEENVVKITAVVDLGADKSIIAKVHKESKGLQYDKNYRIQFEDPKDQKTYYKKSWGYINSLSVDKIVLNDDKDKVNFIEDIEVSSRSYSKKVGNRLLVAPNVFGRYAYKLPKYDQRKTPLVIERGYVKEYEHIINIPENYRADKLPEKKSIDSEFGVYSFELEKVNESQIKCRRSFKLIDGIYPKEKYESYRQFRYQISKIDNTKIILKSNN